MTRAVLRSARTRAPSTCKRLSGMNRNLGGKARFRLQQPTEARRRCFGYSSISSPSEQDLANLQEAPSETDAFGGKGDNPAKSTGLPISFRRKSCIVL